MTRCTVSTRNPAGAVLLGALALLALQPLAAAQGLEKDTRPPIAPDIREDETGLKLQRGDFVAVPIPLSNPTLGSGLIAGAAYFYPQTEEQKAAQPASLTGIAGMYMDNDSKALVIAQQNYWSSNRWRFTGAVGAADLRLSLRSNDIAADSGNLDWRLKGKFAYARLSGQVWKGWYTGLLARLVDVDQSLEANFDATVEGLITLPDIRSAGVGAYLEYDTRDLPTNAYSGRYLKVDALFNDAGTLQALDTIRRVGSAAKR